MLRSWCYALDATLLAFFGICHILLLLRSWLSSKFAMPSWSYALNFPGNLQCILDATLLTVFENYNTLLMLRSELSWQFTTGSCCYALTFLGNLQNTLDEHWQILTKICCGSGDGARPWRIGLLHSFSTGWQRFGREKSSFPAASSEPEMFYFKQCICKEHSEPPCNWHNS